MQVRIVQGPLRGKRWVAGSSNHGCWLGSYEFDKQREIAATVRPGMTCYDIGANVGFYTLLFSELAGARGAVVAFEPTPRNCRFLRRHVSINGCGNVAVQELALGNFDGVTRFDEGVDTSQGHLSATGSLAVRCARIDTLIAAGAIAPPDVMKIDVEGAEAAVLAGGAEVLARCKPTIFLATHGKQVHLECCRFLSALGYRLAPIGGAAIETCDEIVARPSQSQATQ
jgi:FkbM family methyltransferase